MVRSVVSDGRCHGLFPLARAHRALHMPKRVPRMPSPGSRRAVAQRTNSRPAAFHEAQAFAASGHPMAGDAGDAVQCHSVRQCLQPSAAPRTQMPSKGTASTRHHRGGAIQRLFLCATARGIATAHGIAAARRIAAGMRSRQPVGAPQASALPQPMGALSQWDRRNQPLPAFLLGRGSGTDGGVANAWRPHS